MACCTLINLTPCHLWLLQWSPLFRSPHYKSHLLWLVAYDMPYLVTLVSSWDLGLVYPRLCAHRRLTFSYLKRLFNVLKPADISLSSSSTVNDSSFNSSISRYVGGLSTLTCLLNLLCQPNSAKRYILQNAVVKWVGNAMGHHCTASDRYSVAVFRSPSSNFGYVVGWGLGKVLEASKPAMIT